MKGEILNGILRTHVLAERERCALLVERGLPMTGDAKKGGWYLGGGDQDGLTWSCKALADLLRADPDPDERDERIKPVSVRHHVAYGRK